MGKNVYFSVTRAPGCTETRKTQLVKKTPAAYCFQLPRTKPTQNPDLKKAFECSIFYSGLLIQQIRPRRGTTRSQSAGVLKTIR